MYSIKTLPLLYKINISVSCIFVLFVLLYIIQKTVNKAYAMLKQEGFISIDRRHGAKVNPILTPDFEFKEKLEDDLSLVISEAEIRGMKKDEFIKICENIFDSMTNLKPKKE